MAIAYRHCWLRRCSIDWGKWQLFRLFILSTNKANRIKKIWKCFKSPKNMNNVEIETENRFFFVYSAFSHISVHLWSLSMQYSNQCVFDGRHSRILWICFDWIVSLECGLFECYIRGNRFSSKSNLEQNLTNQINSSPNVEWFCWIGICHLVFQRNISEA